MKKYELTNNTMNWDGRTLYQIRALKTFETIEGIVNKGELGGFVESEENLSQVGGCWIFNQAVVADDARVREDAIVSDWAKVYGDAIVCGMATIRDNAHVYYFAVIKEDAEILDNASVHGFAKISGMVVVEGAADICGTAELSGMIQIGGISVLNSFTMSRREG